MFNCVFAILGSSKRSSKRSISSTEPNARIIQRRNVPDRSSEELLDPKVPLRHCQEIYQFRKIRKSGIQRIQLDNGELKDVYCQMEIDGGGWTLLQRREKGDETFERNWDDYAKGFGNLTKDFWLGNLAIHLLTTTAEQMELRLDMLLCNGKKFVVKYKKFRVGPPESRFKLVNIEEPPYAGVGQWPYVGLTEGLMYNIGWEFTTATDSTRENCVKQMGGGGWWYNACATFVNVNGKFGCDQPYPQGNFLYYIAVRKKKYIKSVTMMVRPEIEETGNLQKHAEPYSSCEN